MDTNNFTSTSIYAPAQPVPDAQRLFTERDAFALWFSLGMGLLGAGMSLPHALVAIALGGLLCVAGRSQ